MNRQPFTSTHNLLFGVAPWTTPDFMRFQIGTCEGLWRSTATTYDILAIINKQPGNGHLTDVLEWFEQSCIRDNRDFQVLEVWNEAFKKHLIKKHGFQAIGKDDTVIKHYSK